MSIFKKKSPKSVKNKTKATKNVKKKTVSTKKSNNENKVTRDRFGRKVRAGKKNIFFKESSYADRLLRARLRFIERRFTTLSIFFLVVIEGIGLLLSLFILKSIVIGLVIAMLVYAIILYGLIMSRAQAINSVVYLRRARRISFLKSGRNQFQSLNIPDNRLDSISQGQVGGYYPLMLQYLKLEPDASVGDFVHSMTLHVHKLVVEGNRIAHAPFASWANQFYNYSKIKVSKRHLTNRDDMADDAVSMVGVSLTEIARDGKKKRGGKAKSTTEAIEQLSEMEAESDYVKGHEFRKEAPWYLKPLSDKDFDDMLQMNMTVARMAKWQRNRIVKSVIAGGMIAVIGVVLKILGIFDQGYAIAVAGVVVMPIMYKYQHKEIASALSSWQFKREMQFAKFSRLIVPYLFMMQKTKGSLFSVLQEVSKRLDSTQDRALVIKLMQDIRNSPDSDLPFIDFAKSFSEDPKSVVFMTAINRATQTVGQDHVVADLAEQSNNVLLEKVRYIRRVKESKFALYKQYVAISALVINMSLIGEAMLYQMSHIG